MYNYFPKEKQITLYKNIASTIYELHDENKTTVIKSKLKPNAKVKEHFHEEYQICIVTKGSLEIDCDGEIFTLIANTQALYIPKNIPHKAINRTKENVYSIDIKRLYVPNQEEVQKPILLSLTNSKIINSGIEFSFFIGPWFEIMYSSIPYKGKMNKHKHKNEQIGIGLTGEYEVAIDKTTMTFNKNSVYYAPSNISHSGSNMNEKTATSYNIFIPKKYNKKVNFS